MCEDKRAILIVGHGSRREEANKELDMIVRWLGERHPHWLVQKAYGEFAQPSLEEAVASLAAQGVESIVLVPFFLTVGNHLHKNLPTRLEALRQNYPHLQFIEAKHLGADLLLVQLVEKRIAEAEADEALGEDNHQMMLNSLAQIPLLLEEMAKTASSWAIPAEKQMDIRLCVSEAVNNALIYGNELNAEKWVSVCWHFTPKEALITVLDQGQGVAEDKRCPQNLDPLLMMEESGKGLFLIGQVADMVCYNDCGNQITMRLKW